MVMQRLIFLVYFACKVSVGFYLLGSDLLKINWCYPLQTSPLSEFPCHLTHAAFCCVEVDLWRLSLSGKQRYMLNLPFAGGGVGGTGDDVMEGSINMQTLGEPEEAA